MEQQCESRFPGATPPGGERLRAYRESVVEWAEKRLKPYIQRVEALPSLREKAGKEINDAVWRTSPSPRSRCSSSTRRWCSGSGGSASSGWSTGSTQVPGTPAWSTPSGPSTKFSGLRGDQPTRRRGQRPRYDWVSLLRLAALVHDIGHGLMSHVIENAFKSLGVTDDLRLELADELDEENCR